MRPLLIASTILLLGCSQNQEKDSQSEFDPEIHADHICTCLNILSPAIQQAQAMGDTITSEALEELQQFTTQLLRESKQCLDRLELKATPEQDIAIEKAVVRKCGVLYDLVLKETN